MSKRNNFQDVIAIFSILIALFGVLIVIFPQNLIDEKLYYTLLMALLGFSLGIMLSVLLREMKSKK